MIDQPHPDGVRLLPWRIPTWAVDVSLVGIAAAAVIARMVIEDEAFQTGEWVALGVGVVLLSTRRPYPVPTLIAAIASSAVAAAVTERPPILFPIALVALFTVAQRFPRRIAIIAGALTTLAFLLMITALLRRGFVDAAALASIAWPAFAAAAGAAVRSTRENVAEAEERARRAEASRELEAERRVIEERLRIARDVHDLVAHHIAVVNVQAGVASHLMSSDPPAAEQALRVVRDAASTVIGQLGELLSVLRSADDGEDPTAPTPDLAAIDDLISSFSASGLLVSDERSGSPRPLSDSAELAAYRVVQEALTNAHKHGDGTASVTLHFDDDGLAVIVSNPTGTGPERSDGFGLIGMRERVEAVGGTLDVTESGLAGRFELTASIPRRATS